MDRQTLRDWVHRFNTAGPDGLLNRWSPEPSSRLSPEQKVELAALVENRHAATAFLRRISAVQ